MKKAAIALLVICTAVFAQQKGTFTDERDKKKYKTVNIGGFTWFAENLNYDAEGSKCYEDKPANCTKYGRLYNWETAKTACPSGWHLPSEVGRKALTDFAGESAGKKLKAKSGWQKDGNKSGNGTDNFGFSALPSYSDGSQGIWWSAGENEKNNKMAFAWNVHYKTEAVAWTNSRNKSDFYSVRCLQGTAEEVQAKVDSILKTKFEAAVGKQFNPKIKYDSMTDERNQITYKTIKIGKQTWFAENLNYNEKGSKCFNDSDDSYCKINGRQYDWETAMKVCPSGWHLPSKEEWDALFASAGGEKIAGKKLKAKSGWRAYEGKSGNGTDDFGFSALPSDIFISVVSSTTSGFGYSGMWWSTEIDEKVADFAYSRQIVSASESVGRLYFSKDGRNNSYIHVRCVQD